MNILLVSSYLPFPLTSGGHIRLYNLIKKLSGKHKITLICEKRDYQTEEDIDNVRKICKEVVTVPRKKQWNIRNILTTAFSLSSFLITGHKSREMRKEIKKLINEAQFDLIHVETSYVMQNLPLNLLTPIVLVEHNVEYLVYKRFADSAPLVLRPLLYLDILKLKNWEEGVWKKVKKLVAVSEAEKKIMQKVRKDVAIVSNGVDIQKFKGQPFGSFDKAQDKSAQGESSKFKANGEIRVLFIGDFKWIQNRNSLREIVEEIWPRLRAEFIPSLNGGLKLWVVGKNIPGTFKKLSKDKSVIFDENAPTNTEEIYQKSSLLLAPIRVGGGTSYKILEAMASGVPVLTTKLGNAIGSKENSEVLIADTPEDFVKKIIEVLENKNLYHEIAVNAQALVEEKFNWEKIAKDLDKVYEEAVYA